MNDQLLARYKELDGLRLNMVVTPELAFIGPDGSSRSISNEQDRALLLHLRRISNLVITDAATARAEEYQPSKLVDIEIWSESGNYAGLEASQTADGQHRMDFCQVSDLGEELRNRIARFERVLLETGPTLSRKIALTGLIDEACLTVSASLETAQSVKIARNWQNLMALDYLKIADQIETESATFVRFTR